MKTLIKWPGGKSSEFEKISSLIPSFDRYIEPFFGGGAIFFNLEPKQAIINDISTMLISFYNLVKAQNNEFKNYLMSYCNTFNELLNLAEDNYTEILSVYNSKEYSETTISNLINSIVSKMTLEDSVILNEEQFKETLIIFVKDKFERTQKNNEKKPFSDEDMKENLKTGFTSGYYMYFRNIYNQLALKTLEKDEAYRIANFYFIREYCYGSMFRYNSKGEFNIPYGGISYNKKNFKTKVASIFNTNVENLFRNTEICCSDFENFFETHTLTRNDFMFLDPPYDTEFSDYEGKDFTKNDQARLAECLKKTEANFILIIKNTDYIYNLYKDHFRILTFDKNYTYNVRSRNDRAVEHLIITNLPE